MNKKIKIVLYALFVILASSFAINCSECFHKKVDYLYLNENTNEDSLCSKKPYKYVANLYLVDFIPKCNCFNKVDELHLDFVNKPLDFYSFLDKLEYKNLYITNVIRTDLSFQKIISNINQDVDKLIIESKFMNFDSISFKNQRIEFLSIYSDLDSFPSSMSKFKGVSLQIFSDNNISLLNCEIQTLETSKLLINIEDSQDEFNCINKNKHLNTIHFLNKEVIMNFLPSPTIRNYYFQSYSKDDKALKDKYVDSLRAKYPSYEFMVVL